MIPKLYPHKPGDTFSYAGTGAAATGCVSGTYTSTGFAPGANDDTSNFVCAANGLRRDGANNGAVQNVLFVTV